MNIWRRTACLLFFFFPAVLFPRGECEALVSEDDILAYAALDGSTDIYLPSARGFIRSEFRRAGHAYTPCFSAGGRHQPRYVEGRFGEALFIESGDYGNFSRGTMNLLREESSTARGYPGGFTVKGTASCAKAGRGPAGPAALKVSAEAGGGIETKSAVLPSAMRYIGSVYLKGEKGGERVSVTLTDLTNDVMQKTDVLLTPGWGRYFVVLPYSERDKTFGEKKLEEPIEAVLGAVAEEKAVFYADALMIEQAGRFYSGRFVPSTWIEGGRARATEIFNIPVLPETFNPAAGAVSFWIRYEPGKVARTLFSAGYGWNHPFKLDVRDGQLVYSYFGSRASHGFNETGAWRFIAISWEKNESSVYLDGERVIDVAAESGFGDEDDLWGRHIFLMPGNADSGASFAPKTHLNGAIDEVYVFNRRLDERELRRVKNSVGPLVGMPGIAPVYDMPVRVYSRDMQSAPLRFIFRNATPRAVEGARARFSVSMEGEPVLGQESVFSIGAGGETEVIYQMPAEKLSTGIYRINISTETENSVLDSSYPVRIGPFRSRERLPVLSWSGSGSYRETERMKELGVNVVRGFGQRAVDWAAELGIYTEARMNLRGAPPRRGAEEDMIMRNDGTLHGVNPLSEYIMENTRRLARERASQFKDFDTVRYSIVNTEWLQGMDFSPPFRTLVRDKFGIDLSLWMGGPEAAGRLLHPYNRLNPVLTGAVSPPAGGVVDTGKDNFYRFHLWWHKGAANEQVINNICMDEIRKARPDVRTIIEPILRRPPVRVYGDNNDIAQEWFYYENPRRAVEVQERLAAMTRGTGRKISGMPQFLFKHGGAAPFASVPPPHMLREAVWLCASRPLSMMSFSGWGGVLEKGRMLSIEEIEEMFKGLEWSEGVRLAREQLGGDRRKLFIPEVKEEFASLSETLWEPFGQLMSKWENAPRRAAVVDSFASHLYSNARWHAWGWLGDAAAASGIAFDVLYDEDFVENEDLLSGYGIVLLPNTHAVTDRAHEQLAAFASRGGIIVADEACGVRGLPGLEKFREDMRQSVMELMRTWAGLPVSSRTEEVIWNILEYGGASYLVAVNDRRDFGRYLGKWGRVREEGVAQEAEFAARREMGRHVIDLTASRVLPALEENGWNSFSFEIGPAAGRILMFTDDVPLKFSAVSESANAARGGTASLVFSLEGAGGRMRGGIPFRYRVVEPSGGEFESSSYGLLENGEYTLSFLIPVNAERGKWKVEAEELAARLAAEAYFTVE